MIENPEKVKEIILLNKKAFLLGLSVREIGLLITLLYQFIIFSFVEYIIITIIYNLIIYPLNIKNTNTNILVIFIQYYKYIIMS